jgi:poly [ADP-ribose] polymerase 10/14/15
MKQTNETSEFSRDIWRLQSYEAPTDFEFIQNELPKLPPLWISQFLPTFAGQIICVSKTFKKTWAYGKVVHDSANHSSCRTQGWFPIAVCKPATKKAILQVMTWAPVDEVLVNLPSSSPEYADLVAYFLCEIRYCNTVVTQIQHIQNRQLWTNYVANKDTMIEGYMSNPSKLINNKDFDSLERNRLCHGTSSENILKIVHRGFNRSFAGKNGTTWGKGVYFSSIPIYSKKFAMPDENGIRRMFLCRVAVGDYCIGNQSQVTPDEKFPGTQNHDIFDSTVDDITNPDIFVVYNDAQAYPEYLVSFTSDSD